MKIEQMKFKWIINSEDPIRKGVISEKQDRFMTF